MQNIFLLEAEKDHEGEHERGRGVGPEKGLSVLSCFSWQKSRRTLTEIARELNLPLPTAARLAKALEGQGFLEREKKSRLYSLGFQCYLLGAIAKKRGA